MLERLEKGLYCKPQLSRFGSLRPDPAVLLNELLDRKKGYVTGTAAFNSFGLTSQVPGTIVVAAGSYRSPRKIGGLTIRYRRSKIDSTTASPQLLQLLDALRSVKRIPDAGVDQVISRVIDIIGGFNGSVQRELVACASQYNPSVRALVAAIFSFRFKNVNIDTLARSLNPLSSYAIGVSLRVLPNKSQWKIK